MEQFVSLRLDTIARNIDNTLFDHAVDDLRSTQYNINAIQEDAPQSTHCITAVRYIIEKSTWIILPKMYIGDFCRTIYEEHTHLEPKTIPITDHERWDLVFFMKKSQFHLSYMISHVGIFMDDNGKFFHSNPSQWWQLDKLSQHINRGKIATCRILSNYTDPRRKIQ